ncbi:MAG TPA: fibronectin type III domain-containing protein, partial [Cyclobacteriaceae bacterium]
TLLDQQVASISGCSATTSCANTGAYTLITAGFDLCPSPSSKAKYVIMGVNNSAITPPVITTKPSNLTGRITSPSSILFTWNDNSKDERGYELWRRTSTDASTTPWQLAVLTDEDVTQFHDTGLQPNTTYYYKIRAVNNSGRSDYYPGNSTTNIAQHYVISTGTDTQKPTPPQNLVATVTGIQTISLTWTAATDDSGLKDYYVYYGTDSILMGSTNTTYVFGKTQLLLNTNYNFTVRAVDLYGNLSSKSNQVSANTYVDGLYYEHSTGAWTDVTAIPWTTAVPEFTGKVANITLAGPPPAGPRTQDDYFNFRFYGYLYIVKNGSYTFRLYSNDGSELYIDGTRRIQRKGTVADGTCSNSTSAAITLSANSYHTIEIRYYDYTGSQCLDLQYKGPDPGNSYVSVPSSKLKSYNVITTPTAPLAITNLTATAISMTQINLAWSFTGTLPANYEVYRSTSLTGTYSMIGRIATTSLSDVGLTPGTAYYYKIKTVDNNGTSAFSSVATTATLSDTQVPTQPTALTVTASTFTTVSLVWTASTDNVKVTGYEVWANGVLIGTSAINGYLATSLTPNTAYNFSVIAYDASGNKSPASGVATTNTSAADVYYSNASGALNAPATWGKNTDGSGTLATTFANNGQYFIVSNRTTSSLGGQWSVDGSISKVIVPSGVSLTVDNTFTARTEVQANATVNINSASTPQFISLAQTSTVNYNYTSSGNAYVQQNTYGNLGLYGAGNKVFASGTTTVLGNITGDAGIAFKGAPDNTTKLIVQGDITVNGAPAFTAPDFGIDLELSKGGTQTITSSGDLYFEKVTLTGSGNTSNVVNGGTPFSINVGTFNGGGVTIPAGATLNLNANNIVLAKNSVINGNNETGRIAISGGTLDLTSTSSSNSNLYFNPTNHSAKQLNVNLTGTGKAMVREAMEVTTGIKIKNGELSSSGNITMISNASGTANLQEIEGTGVLTGDVNVQRYIDPKGVVYRYISTSVAGTTAGNWETFFPLTGSFVCYKYDHEAWVRYATTTPTSQYPIEKGRGYSVYLRNGASPINMHVAGNPYQGNIALPLDPDPSSASTDGWNLVGNPYASTITWGSTGWVRSAGINSTISVRNNPTGVFMYYDYTTGLGTLTGGKIAPGQAFWVQVTTSNPSLTITEKAKSTEQQSLFREATDPDPVSHITLSLQQGTKEDVTYIAFTELGKDTQDPEYDAVKQVNPGQFSFSSLTSDKVSAAINNMSNRFCSKITKLNVQPLQPVTSGTYSLVVSEIESLGTIGQIVLRDNYAKTNTLVVEGSVYNFSIISTDTSSYGASRFSLQVSRPDLGLSSVASADNVCNLDSATIKLSNTQEGVSYYAINGANNKISNTYTGNGGDIFIVIPKENLTEGGNAISLAAGFEGCSTQTLPVSLNINYSTAPVAATEQSVTGCQGSTVILKSSGAPSGGSYKWYDSNQNEISGATGDSFETPTLQDFATYYVSALTASGCESPKVEIDITGQAIDIPTLDIRNDTLFATSNNFILWYRNGELINNATGLFFVPSLNGEYTVESDQNGCVAESAPVQYGNSITGTSASPDGGLRLVVYPNPAPRTNVNFKISSSSSADIHVQLVDLLGKTSFSKLMSITEAEDGYKLETSVSLKNGVYFVVIDQGNKTIKKKLVVLD